MRQYILLFNPLNAELNPICHLLALLGGATIVVVSRLRVNKGICALKLVNEVSLYYDARSKKHKKIRIFFRTNFNAHFNMNMYVTLSSTCFGP